MFREKRQFKNSKGLTLSAIYEGENRNAPTVLMCHGYGSSKDSESNADLARHLIESGFCVYRFDFTGSGESDGTLDMCTPMQGFDDLECAVRDLGKKTFSLYGNSYGGFIALMYASQNPVLALTLKAPVSDYISVEAKKSKDNFGFTDIKKGNFIRELKSIDLYKDAKNIRTPTLIVHGDQDEIVPIDQSKKLIKNLGSKNKHLEIIRGATHRMRGESMQKAHECIVEFLRKELL